jgi:hypothetical protein
MTQVVISPLDHPSYAVHIHEDGDLRFGTGFAITEYDDGRTIKVSLFQKPDSAPIPGAEWWRTHAAEHFPKAEAVRFDRLTADGLEEVTFPLRRARNS